MQPGLDWPAHIAGSVVHFLIVLETSAYVNW